MSRRSVPTLVAGTLALVYVIAAPPSIDLAAHVLRARLFGAEGFGLWNNWWYGGHHDLSYSVLFPPLAWLVNPQVPAAIAATLTATVFELVAFAAFGQDAGPGAIWFGAATAENLYTGRLTFAFGLLPALAAVLALQRRRPFAAAGLAAASALASPVAALFAALAGAATAMGGRWRDDRFAGAAVVLAALLPVLALALAFPEGGSEPFAFSAFWPIPLICTAALWMVPREQRVLRIGVALYALGCFVAYAIPTAAGGNVARLLPLFAGPLAVMIFWRRRGLVLALACLPLLYLPAEAPVRDLLSASGDPSVHASYYRPLLAFLRRAPGAPFRVEIPFTDNHWEADYVAPSFPLARGWERQLDVADNALFYDGRLTATRYERWLHTLSVRYVALADAGLDYSARAEAALIRRGLPYLRLVHRTLHWRIYEVARATSLAGGAAVARGLGPNSVTLLARRRGSALVRVRWSPYWRLTGVPGCVAPAGAFTRVILRRPGDARLVMAFALDRIRSTAPRCG